MKIIILLTIVVAIYGEQGFGPGTQKWGHIKVRPHANMFFWLYKTKWSCKPQPLIIWLQGGPGCSSTGFGNFMEIGPWDLNLTARSRTWIDKYHVLFIDNPVGAGFSYVDKQSALTKTNKQIGRDLVEFLKKFYVEFPELKCCPLRIAGESYGGKMAAQFVLLLTQDPQFNNLNLVGITLIDSWISPIDIVTNYAPFLYYSAEIDKKDLNQIEKAASATKITFFEKRYESATDKWLNTLDIILNVTNNIDLYNIHTEVSLNSDFNKQKLEALMNGPVKKTLGLSEALNWTMDNPLVFDALKSDFMKPVTAIIEQLLEASCINIQVVTGEFDLIVNTPGTLQWVNKLSYLKKRHWIDVPRTPFKVNDVIEGFKKVLHNFSLYWVKRSGHMVPVDNPSAMLAILNDFNWKWDDKHKST